ncbi:MAG: SusC/RagA family TonB-linked outer membrane protein [Chitinophagaceae bacterium]|nr:SusC/RagA family TonB-linked outer membrane protein [Chitinophagaceae bacterium]
MKKMLILFLLVLPVSLLAQQTVTGKVTDEKSNPIAFASIQEKGKSNTVIADANGAFTITVQNGNAVLIITSAEFLSQEIKVNNQAIVNGQLKSSGNLDEVVVTAFGVKKQKRSLGYSTQEVKAEDLAISQQPNLLNALQGKVSGVQINSGGGAPGQGASILIRGVKSLGPGKNNQPLFVIDGVIMDNSTNLVGQQAELRGMSNRAADLNPDDIESVSVLKGGAASALYGQAGSNGVVIITTKSGKAGKIQVGVTATYGIDQVNKFPDVQSKYTQGYTGSYDSVSFWPVWGPTIAEAKAIDPSHPDQIFDQYARGYQNGNQFRTNVNMSGGSENAIFSSSLSYFKQEGTIPFTDYRNISARINATIKVGSKITFNPSVYYISSGGYRYNADRYNESLTYWSPRWDVMDYVKPDGTMKTYGNNNPIYGASTNRFKDDVNRMIASMHWTYSPFKWLDFDYRLGLDQANDLRTYTAPGPLGLVGERTYEDNGLGFVYEYRIRNRILNSNLSALLKHDWSKKFETTLRLGTSSRDEYYNRVTAEGDELDIPTLLSLNNTKIRYNSEYLEKYRIASFYGELTAAWDNFLFLTVTERNDRTSALAPGNNSYFYPSVSLAGVFSDKIKLPSWWSYGKVRASWAQIGKDYDPYSLNTYYSSYVVSSTGQVLWTRDDQKGDASLQPERTTTLEIGTELRFLKNRLGVDFSWYKLNSRDQIIPVSISPTTGYTSTVINAGEIENKGIELTLTGKPITNKNFTWDINLNYTANRSKVLSITDELKEIVIGSQYGYASATVTMKYVPGQSVGTLYGASYLRYYNGKADDGITLQKDLPYIIATTGSNRGFPVRDGTQRNLGNVQPKWIGGIVNSFRYKQFGLSFQFDTQQGMYKYNQLGNFMAAFGIAKYTEDRDTPQTYDGVYADGTVNTMVVYSGQGTKPDGRNYGASYYRNVYRGVSENFVEDASWIRLRNLTMSYQLPKTALGKSFIKDATISVTGNNLWLSTDFSGFDPESSSFSAGSNMSGFAGFSYPAMRSYMLSLNLKF